jgi:hypothetical protein
MAPARFGTVARFTRRGTRAAALTGAVVLLALSSGTGVASADAHRDHRAAENTFTKWITTFPAMAGVVGGDVGTGSFAGEILTYSPGNTPADPTVIEARYHFNGSRHSFSALVHVEQTGLSAAVTGVVTEGWLRGNPVSGRYMQIDCAESPNGTCFRGTLDVLRGGRD